MTHEERRDRRQKIAARVQGGETGMAVAKDFGVTGSVVSDACKEFGVDVRRGRPIGSRNLNRVPKVRIEKPQSELKRRAKAMPSTCGVYRLRNLVTDECYIGSSLNLRRRAMSWSAIMESADPARSSSRKVIASVRIHGLDAFHFEIVQLCREDRRLEIEQRAIDLEKPALNLGRWATCGRGQHRRVA